MGPRNLYLQTFGCQMNVYDSERICQLLAARPDLKEKPDHQAVLDGRNQEKRFCTDCHGDHRMFFRTKGWDRRTGVLLFKDGIPRMVQKKDEG